MVGIPQSTYKLNCFVPKHYDGYNYSTAGFSISLDRILHPFVFNVYLPSGILVAAAWISFFIPPAVVPGRMALIVTTLLMLINVSATVNASSPTTSSLTNLDLWMLGT